MSLKCHMLEANILIFLFLVGKRMPPTFATLLFCKVLNSSYYKEKKGRKIMGPMHMIY